MPTFKMSKEAAQQTVNQIIRDCRIKEAGNMTYDYWMRVKSDLDQLEELNWYKSETGTS